MHQLESWREDAPVTRLSVWGPGSVTLACVLVMPFVHVGEFRGVLAVLAVTAAVRSSTAQLALRLTRHMSPVEEAWKVGYQTGYEDGEAVGILDPRNERRRGVDRRQHPGLHPVEDQEA